jgi:UDP:flavonoid glycosyltransferase YjiC (YdhE family)
MVSPAHRHFGLMCPPVSGHLNPTFVLGRELARRGHRVSAVFLHELAPKVRAEGLEMVGIDGPEAPAGGLQAWAQELGRRSGLDAARFSVDGACRLIDLFCREAPARIRAAGIDALVVDQNEPAGGSIAEHLGMPFVNVCTSLPLNRAAEVPPPFVPWGFGTTAWHLFRNWLGYRLTDILIRPLQQRLNHWRSGWSLRALRTPDDSFSRLAQVAQVVTEYEFPRARWPQGFHATGPFIDAHFNAQAGFPWERLDPSGARPLVYASLGTLQNQTLGYFRTIAESCAGLPVQLVISLGGAALPQDLASGRERWPGEPIVVPYAPQVELLKRATLMITHAGMNTVLHCLALGVPMVAVPITNDQPGIAARARHCGAATVLPLARLSAAALRDRVQQVLREPSYRLAAQRIAHAIERAGGVTRAADVIESAVSSGRA